MAIAAPVHHAVLRGMVRMRNGERRVGKDRRRYPLVSHFLFQGIQRISRDAHNGVDAKCPKLADVRFHVLDLIPAWLTGQPFLEEEEDCLPTQRGEIKGAAISRLKPN